MIDPWAGIQQSSRLKFCFGGASFWIQHS